MSESKYLPEISNMQLLHNKPFHLTDYNIRDGKVVFEEEYRTNYAFYINKIKKGLDKNKRGIRKDGVFMTRLHYAKDEFKPDEWTNYEYKDETTGRMNNYFEKKFIAEVEFTEPQLVDIYDREAKKTVPQQTTTALVFFSASVVKKLMEQMNDPRSSLHDNFVVLYTPANPPSTKYAVKYHSVGKALAPKPVTQVAATPRPVVSLYPHEVELLNEIKGESTNTNSLVEFITLKANRAKITSLTPERIKTIAESVLVNGVVTF